MTAPDAPDQRPILYGEYLKAGLGYNFTACSDDLTDLSYDDRGLFLKQIGKV